MTRYIYLDGHRHDILTTDRFEELAHSAELDVELHPGSDWATTILGDERFAARITQGEVA